VQGSGFLNTVYIIDNPVYISLHLYMCDITGLGNGFLRKFFKVLGFRRFFKVNGKRETACDMTRQAIPHSDDTIFERV